MTTFNEAHHPRGTAGRFTEKAAGEPQTSSFDMWFDRVRSQYDHATVVGRDAYRTAVEVTRSGLVGVVVDETRFDRQKNPSQPFVDSQTSIRVFDSVDSAADFARTESGDDADPEETFEGVAGDPHGQSTRTQISIIHPKHLPIGVPDEPSEQASDDTLAKAYVEASQGYARSGQRLRAFEHNEPVRQAMHLECSRWRARVDELSGRLSARGMDLDVFRDEGDARITDRSGRVLQRF